MKSGLIDRKSWFSYAFLSFVNWFALFLHFRKIEVMGNENVPKNGAFLLISNHCSRWDSLIVQKVLNRPGNFMASPNELRGLQGKLLPGIGAFPARASRQAISFIIKQVRRGEPLVIFPEGNVFRDSITHPFKTGTAKIALGCNQLGLDVPIVPIAIKYDDPCGRARVLIGAPIHVQEYLEQFNENPNAVTKTLTCRLHREICHLKIQLGQMSDSDLIFIGKPVREWVPRLQNVSVKQTAFQKLSTPQI